MCRDCMYELWEIGKKHLRLNTLEAGNSDDINFRTVSVWCLREALQAAYEFGKGEGSMTLGELLPFLKEDARLFVEFEPSEEECWVATHAKDEHDRKVLRMELLDTDEPMGQPHHTLHIVLERR